MEKCKAVSHCPEFMTYFKSQFRLIGCRILFEDFGVVDSIFMSLKICCNNSTTVFFSKKMISIPKVC